MPASTRCGSRRRVPRARPTSASKGERGSPAGKRTPWRGLHPHEFLSPCSTSRRWPAARRPPGRWPRPLGSPASPSSSATSASGSPSTTACPRSPARRPRCSIAHLANATTTLRVGSGGVMLPNHAPLVSPSSSGRSKRSIRSHRSRARTRARHRSRHRPGAAPFQDLSADSFPDDVVELIRYLMEIEGPARPPRGRPRSRLPPGGVAARVVGVQRRARRDARAAVLVRVPLQPEVRWTPRSSGTARRSVPRSCWPSRARWSRSRCCVRRTDDEAQWLSGPSALAILQLRSGKLGLLPTPEEAEAYEYSPAEAAVVAETTATHLVGDPETVHAGLVDLQRRTDADEIMLSTRAHSYEARVRSLDAHRAIAGRQRRRALPEPPPEPRSARFRVTPGAGRGTGVVTAGRGARGLSQASPKVPLRAPHRHRARHRAGGSGPPGAASTIRTVAGGLRRSVA